MNENMDDDYQKKIKLYNHLKPILKKSNAIQYLDQLRKENYRYLNNLIIDALIHLYPNIIKNSNFGFDTFSPKHQTEIDSKEILKLLFKVLTHEYSSLIDLVRESSDTKKKFYDNYVIKPKEDESLYETDTRIIRHNQKLNELNDTISIATEKLNCAYNFWNQIIVKSNNPLYNQITNMKHILINKRTNFNKINDNMKINDELEKFTYDILKTIYKSDVCSYDDLIDLYNKSLA